MKNFSIKTVMPVFVALSALTLGSCSQDELTDQSQSGNMNSQTEIKAYLRSLPLAPHMTRASDPVGPDDGTPIPVEDDGSPTIESRTTLNGIPGYWVKTSRRYKMTQNFDENYYGHHLPRMCTSGQLHIRRHIRHDQQPSDRRCHILYQPRSGQSQRSA